MRNISAASLAALQQESGLEPVIIVRVWWGGTTYISYADKKFESEGLVGKLLEISGIEDIVDINSSASSVNLSVTLDDTNGEIKQIYDTKDIHKTFVQVLQWFKDIPLTDAFTIFEGELSSPITWSEGTRTLRFDVVTKLEDRELGFSVEEGNFNTPVNLVGKAWPIVFGRVGGVKVLPLSEAPTAILSSGFGIVDQDVWEQELDDLRAALDETYRLEKEAYQLGVNNAFIAGAFKPFGPLPDDPSQAEQYDNAAQSYFAQAYDYAIEFERLTLELKAKEEEKAEQEALEFRVLPITQTNLPTGIQFTVEISNYTATAVVIGDFIILTNLAEKVDVNEKTGTTRYGFETVTDEYKKEFTGQKFVWIDGGTEIKVFNFPRYFIASINHVTVLNVWAYNKYGRSVVPKGWYVVQHVSFGSLLATRIFFPTPLTSYPGEWQDGDIEIDCVSTIGPNVVDILRWAINNFCSYTFDAASFNHVEAKLAAYPANFALTERKEVVRFLQEVAFQSRCAIWINDRKFFLRYLPEQLAAVETLTDDDIEVNSVVVSSTETERLVTKFVALWKHRHNQSEPNKIIYRYNIKKYGVLEEEYNFYIYNNASLVAKSAEFWMIRKSNTWKRISCKALLHKLRIETFDPVEFTFTENLVSTGPIIGIIEKATYNPDDDSISIEAWLPIRLGEMTRYDFAQPMNVQKIFPVKSDPNIITGNPFEDATGDLAPPITYGPYIPMTHVFGPAGRSEPIGDTGDVAPATIVTALSPNEINSTRPLGINNFNNEKRWLVNPIKEFTFKAVIPNSMYGEVISKIEDDTRYRVDVYVNGLSNPPTALTVNIGFIPEDEELNPGYPIAVHRLVYTKSDGTVAFEYWAQPPIWVDNEDNPTP